MTRKEYILHKLRDKHRVGIEELAEKLKVSTITIRRDLKILEDEGLLSRVHGGASLPFGEDVDYKSFSSKERSFIAEKKKIAKRVSSFITNDSIIFLNGGSTTATCLAELRASNLQIFTNNAVARSVQVNSGICVHYTGGILDNYSQSFYGDVAHNSIQGIKADFCILGANAVSAEDGIASYSFNEYSLNQKMLEHTIGKSILAIDHSKINQISNFKFCDLEEIDIIVTGKECPQDFVSIAEELGIKICLV